MRHPSHDGHILNHNDQHIFVIIMIIITPWLVIMIMILTIMILIFLIVMIMIIILVIIIIMILIMMISSPLSVPLWAQLRICRHCSAPQTSSCNPVNHNHHHNDHHR